MRTLVSLTSTRVKWAISLAARSNGIQVLRWTRSSCRRGLSGPGSNCSSSSRGKKTGSTGRAARVIASQAHRFAAVRQDGALLLALALQRLLALGATWTFAQLLVLQI